MKKMETHSIEKTEVTDVSRRNFLKMTGIVTLGIPLVGMIELNDQNVSIISDPEDKIAASNPAQWATNELIAALKAAGIKVTRYAILAQSPVGSLCIVAGGSLSKSILPLLNEAKSTIPDVPEALGLVSMKSAGKEILIAC
jgi:hypothetical protein